jgi:uncharacterized protein YecT (DUF1311 family)
MEEFFRSLSIHAPIFDLGWTVAKILVVAAAAGLLLGLYCRLVLGAFLIWGLLVGFLGVLFVWLLVSVLALKWTILFAGGVALLIGALFYLDEQSPVTGSELVAAATTRNSHLLELFDRDPDATASIAETLNLGIEESDPRWPSDSALAGIPKRVTRSVRLILTFGFSVLAILALFVYWGMPSPGGAVGVLSNYDELSLYETECNELSGIQEEQCLLSHTEELEARLSSLLERSKQLIHDRSENQVLPLTANQMDMWKLQMLISYREWTEYRDSTCDTIKYLTHFGSGTGRFVARCRLRMTFEQIRRLETYGAGYPDYE